MSQSSSNLIGRLLSEPRSRASTKTLPSLHPIPVRGQVFCRLGTRHNTSSCIHWTRFHVTMEPFLR
ncbi:hypothetical protein E2C01_083006 [Portunus trituberculatus]|uniref:Uncharacterized protein n=1 Tax=Portunus trituberculatus TaxID=210409 RepID=A0A5B7J0S7_PORTR|nr:hypothetical protein [Portunus trituberculatus]